MGHELPIGIIKFVFWDMGYMHHLIRGIITFKWATKNSINNYQNLEVFLILGGPISSSKYQWEKPWFGVPIFWETPGYMNPWVAGRLLQLAGDTRHLHETAQLQGKEQRLLPGVVACGVSFLRTIEPKIWFKKQWWTEILASLLFHVTWPYVFLPVFFGVL